MNLVDYYIKHAVIHIGAAVEVIVLVIIVKWDAMMSSQLYHRELGSIKIEVEMEMIHGAEVHRPTNEMSSV